MTGSSLDGWFATARGTRRYGTQPPQAPFPMETSLPFLPARTIETEDLRSDTIEPRCEILSAKRHAELISRVLKNKLPKEPCVGVNHPLPELCSTKKGTDAAFAEACDLLESGESPTGFFYGGSGRGASNVLMTDRRILAWHGRDRKDMKVFPPPPATVVKLAGLIKIEHLISGELKHELLLKQADTKRLANAISPSSTADANTVASQRFGGKTITIYSNGFVQVAGILSDPPPEKLVAIVADVQVTKKTGLGRGAAAVVTGGWSLATTPNKRGDIYLTIITERQSYKLHTQVPMDEDIKAVTALEAAGRAVLEASSRNQEAPVTHQSTEKSVPEQIRDMKALLDEGLVTQADFDQFKKRLLG